MTGVGWSLSLEDYVHLRFGSDSWMHEHWSNVIALASGGRVQGVALVLDPLLPALQIRVRLSRGCGPALLSWSKALCRLQGVAARRSRVRFLLLEDFARWLFSRIQRSDAGVRMRGVVELLVAAVAADLQMVAMLIADSDPLCS